MQYVRLGKTGLEVSRICFGCMSFGTVMEERPWVLGLDEARPLFRIVWDAGINFFDTANVLLPGTSEEIFRCDPQGVGAARRNRGRHQGFRLHAAWP